MTTRPAYTPPLRVRREADVIFSAWQQLPLEERLRLTRAARALLEEADGLGVKGLAELYYRLGRFLNGERREE